MKPRISVGWIALALVIAGGLALWWLTRGDRAPHAAESRSAPPAATAAASPVRAAKPPVVVASDDSGVIDGRVIDGVTHDGVPGAELTFAGDGGVSTFRTSSDGSFELAPPVAGSFVLSAITAPGFLPYAPEPGQPRLRVTLAHGQSVRGVTLLLYPAEEYQGVVVDKHHTPVAGARVRYLGSAATDQGLDSPPTEWQTGPDGSFTFQAADGSLLEASRGSSHGWAVVDRSVRIQKKLTIELGRALPRDTLITGHVRDTRGTPIADAAIRASPWPMFRNMAAVYATTAADGAFTLAGVDRGSYDLSIEAEGHVRGVRENVLGGSRNVEVILDAGLALAGRVVDGDGAPVPVFSVIAQRHAGSARPIVASQSVIDPQGRFAMRVPPGDYDVLASVRGHARGTLAHAAAGTTDMRIVIGRGATLRGRVIAADDDTPIGDAQITCSWFSRIDAASTAPSALASDPGATSRPDGSFELTGIAAGPLAIRVRADGFHSRIEAAMTASDGAMLGPITIELNRVESDEHSHTEMVGIGVDLSPDGDALRVTRILPGSGAFDAGIGFGDRITAIDGLPVAPLGVEGAIARIRGVAGTTVTVTVQRGGHDIQLAVERRLLRG